MKRLAKVMLILVAGIIVIIIALMAIYWAPDRSVAELKQWQLPNSEFIEIDGTRVHVVQSALCGQYQSKTAVEDSALPNAQMPKAIVLLHGTSASLHTWDGWAEALDDEYCVVRIDLPGFGLTGPFQDASQTYSSANYAAVVTRVIDKLHLPKATFAGNSLGGKIAWRIAALYPDYVENLILIDAVGYPAASTKVPIGFKLAKYPALKPVLTRILPRDMVRKSIVSVYADESKVTEDLVTRYYELTLRQGNRHSLSKRLREFDNIEDQDQIAKLKVPTLILWGAKDELIPVENAALFHKDIKESQLTIFDSLGHVPHEEDPIATVTAAKQFLDQHAINNKEK